MKRLHLIIPLLGLFLTVSCGKDGTGSADKPKSDGELIFFPRVEEMKTRGIGNNFFDEGYGIDVNITTNNGNAYDGHYEYIYHSDGTFRGNPSFYFTLDDNYITELTATWPSEEIRSKGIEPNQSTLANFRLADWLTAVATVDNVMPTEAAVPLNFVRENTMLEFELVGQNTAGINIDSMVLELRVGTDGVAYSAYCGNDDGHAYVILAAGTQIVSEGNELIGIIKVNEADIYYIMLPEMSATLAAGTRYLVTLSPAGYDVNPYVYIVGWSQTESGIGIPFVQPEPDENGSFTIETGAQLIAMSFLIRHYFNPATFDWENRTYILSPDLEITGEDAERYIPVPASYTGVIILQNGVAVTSIPYGDGQTLELYDNDN